MDFTGVVDHRGNLETEIVPNSLEHERKMKRRMFARFFSWFV